MLLSIKTNTKLATGIPICDVCGKNPASVFIARRKNGVTIKRVVCSKCAPGAAEEVTPGQTEPHRFLRSIFDQHSKNPNDAFACKLCGTQLAEIISEGKPGCSLCYTRFSGELMQVIESIQPRRYHVGKTPPH